VTARLVARVMALAVAAAALPGCIAVFGSDSTSEVETPTGEKLTSLEKRMDRVEERLPKRVE
jgi:hypothetical protein